MPQKTSTQRIGEKVRELRRERRWTQHRLAGALGISQGQLSKLERGGADFSADQLLRILRQFNVPLDYFSARAVSAGSQIQNALARQGASHLAESEDVLPSEKLKAATNAIREALVSGDSARQIAATAPVLVNHANQINLTRLRNEFAALGLENRFGWALESILDAIRRESQTPLPREWRVRYRRAETIIQSQATPYFALHPTQSPNDPPPPLDVLDPEITTPESLAEVRETLSPLAQRWRIATRIETDDFVRALRGARGAD